jgi:hypothetical protein
MSRKRTVFKQRPSATPSLERQQWLEAVVEALRTKFAEAGYTVPEKIRVSIGWPKLSAARLSAAARPTAPLMLNRREQRRAGPEVSEHC